MDFREQNYGNHSSGNQAWGNQGYGDRGSSGLGYGADSGRNDQHHDPDYHQWRSEQMQALDNDYRNWRQDRYKKFSDEFSNWRQSHTGQSASGGNGKAESGNATDNPVGTNGLTDSKGKKWGLSMGGGATAPASVFSRGGGDAPRLRS